MVESSILAQFRVNSGEAQKSLIIAGAARVGWVAANTTNENKIQQKYLKSKLNLVQVMKRNAFSRPAQPTTAHRGVAPRQEGAGAETVAGATEVPDWHTWHAN